MGIAGTGSDLAEALRADMSESEFDDICIDADELLDLMEQGDFISARDWYLEAIADVEGI